MIFEAIVEFFSEVILRKFWKAVGNVLNFVDSIIFKRKKK